MRGKILRVEPRRLRAAGQSRSTTRADGLRTTDLVFAWGLRNPFGGAWREADGALWEVENGPRT